MAITQERKNEIIKEYRVHETTLVHQKYKSLFNCRNRCVKRTHVTQKRPPFTSWIIKNGSRRRHLLNYLRGKDIQRYRELIKSLGIRR